jgi:multidrug efflux pump subunit AcrA (membrane-fusion protein)
MNGIVKRTPAIVTVDLPGHPGSRFTGEVVFVSPEISAVNGRFRVWAEVDNPQGLLKPGLRANLEITPTAAERAQLREAQP